ncbi:hypothetical protein BTBSAS_190022 [Brochothrix thermosphacta]|uniref:Uncharacterized protein n=1 Tax=Brochothrix thermosphacta TaxID=2756 RepID=A0A2X0QGY2_BROTH|nr:hypothetical protein BTBSAS_190022 [Brochothrix thermosphacta]
MDFNNTDNYITTFLIMQHLKSYQNAFYTQKAVYYNFLIKITEKRI